MKGIRLIALAGSMLALASTSCAYAAMPVPFGWYLEGNFGVSKTYNKYYPGDVKRTGFGFNFDGGYKFNPFLAGEVGITRYATTTVKNSAGAQAAKDSHYSYDLAGKVMLPIGGLGAEIFGKLGVARVNSFLTEYPLNAALNGLVFYPGTHDTTGVYMAAGGDYAFTHHLLANLQWARSQGNSKTGNMDLYSAGVSYIF